MDDTSVALLMIFLFAAALGLIPAAIARNKGRDFGAWWFYGACLFLIAFIHALLLRSWNEPSSAVVSMTTSPAEELRRFARLRDEGVITEDEFQLKKKDLLRSAG